MKVSVIIVGYNGAKYLTNALDSLLNLDFPKKDYEIIYIDNNSKDNSIKIVTEYGKKYENIRIIKNESNLGFVGGNNIGIKASKSKYIALFNQDAIADTKWLSELINVFESVNRIGAVGGKIYYLNSEDIYFSGGRIFYGGFTWNWTLKDKENECDHVSGCAMLIKRDILEQIGLLDEDYFTYYEETDLCARIRKAGYKIYYTPKAIVWHDIPKKRNRPSRSLTYYMNRNRVIYCYKNYKLKNLFLILDILILYNILVFYEILRVPRSILYFEEFIKARIDSIKYCIGYNCYTFNYIHK